MIYVKKNLNMVDISRGFRELTLILINILGLVRVNTFGIGSDRP